jgi:hypothetical protein
MALADLQRAVYHLSVAGTRVDRPADPGDALARLRALGASDTLAQLPAFQLPLALEPAEAELVAAGDVVGLYCAGVHPNLIRNFAATFGVDYRARYREAGL